MRKPSNPQLFNALALASAIALIALLWTIGPVALLLLMVAFPLFLQIPSRGMAQDASFSEQIQNLTTFSKKESALLCVTFFMPIAISLMGCLERSCTEFFVPIVSNIVAGGFLVLGVGAVLVFFRIVRNAFKTRTTNFYDLRSIDLAYLLVCAITGNLIFPQNANGFSWAAATVGSSAGIVGLLIARIFADRNEH
ncbi:MAG: hypothetical protein ACM3SV_13305 [Betaproteobacteria bacterium]